MTDEVHIIINDEAVLAPAGSTVLEAARAAGIDIPTICYHEHLKANARIRTDSDRVHSARRTILEMLGSAVDLSEAPEIQAMMAHYHADPERFGADAARRQHGEVKVDNPFYVRDYDKCILCWRCVQVCAEDVQFTFALGFDHRGFDTGIATFFDRPMPETTCVFCGNCVGACPTGALKDRRVYAQEMGT
jgi:predicted molibdopterin-dependent oxidoreductase YjgC